MDAFWIILTGSFVAVSCALLGSFLVLRKMAMVADAVSHAVLPGLVIAFLISGNRNSVPMLLGAALVGVLTTWLIETLKNRFRLQTDAAIGVVFTALFSLGVILVSAYADQVELDQECILFGEIAYVPLDIWVNGAGQVMGPIPTWILGGLLVLVLGFVTLGYKGLHITTFDENYALSLGISTLGWHYALMSMVSVTTVVSFDAVGAILVVAFFVIPAATAYLLTKRLRTLLWLSSTISVASVVLGYGLAVWLDSSIAGSIATVSGTLFCLVMAGKSIKRWMVSRQHGRLEAAES